MDILNEQIKNDISLLTKILSIILPDYKGNELNTLKLGIDITYNAGGYWNGKEAYICGPSIDFFEKRYDLDNHNWGDNKTAILFFEGMMRHIVVHEWFHSLFTKYLKENGLLYLARNKYNKKYIYNKLEEFLACSLENLYGLAKIRQNKYYKKKLSEYQISRIEAIKNKSCDEINEKFINIDLYSLVPDFPLSHSLMVTLRNKIEGELERRKSNGKHERNKIIVPKKGLRWEFIDTLLEYVDSCDTQSLKDILAEVKTWLGLFPENSFEIYCKRIEDAKEWIIEKYPVEEDNKKPRPAKRHKGRAIQDFDFH